jgi:hypothetical protein
MKIQLHGFVVLAILIATGCSSNPKPRTTICDSGKTLLDGVCVSQSIADYASCVRSQRVELNLENNSILNGKVTYWGIGVEGAREYSEKLKKTYSSTDNVMYKIIEQCDRLAGISVNKHQSNQDSTIVSVKEYGLDLSDSYNTSIKSSNKFENANYWTKAYLVVHDISNKYSCAKLCIDDDQCKVASYHDSTVNGWENMCALRNEVNNKHINQSGIESWVK